MFGGHMKITRTIAVGSTVLFGAVIAFAANSSAPTSAPTRLNYSDYSVVAEKNIFLRDRSRGVRDASSRPSSSSTTQHVKAIEETLVLTGIVFEDGEFHAYVEDTSADKVLKLAPGDNVGHGRVGQIEIDALLYQTNTKPPLWVEIGSDFTGKEYSAFAANDPYASSSSGSDSFNLTGSNSSSGKSASQPAINPNDPNLTVEQRMRLRAQQQRSSGRR
jgi:hypothetical protein